MRKTIIIFFIIFNINANASMTAAILKGLDSLVDDLFSSSKPIINDRVYQGKKAKVIDEDDIVLSSKQYDIVQNDSDTYLIKWKDTTLNNMCNKEEAKAKGTEFFKEYIEYQKAFYMGTLTEKILHDQILKRLSKKLILDLAIKKIEISTIGIYPYVKEISVELFSACGYQISYDIVNLNFTAKGYRIKSEIKH